jgi:hypothetical protein
MRLETACKDAFARHETFHPRFGWFRKAFIAAASDPAIFNDADATVRLGVGKNMVRSLRFWGTAAHLLVEQSVDGARQRDLRPTNVATALLHPSHGLDPYMEDGATWWWLHWLLLGPGCELPVWWLVFHELSVVEIDDDLLLRACRQAIDSSTWDTPHESSIAKDIAAFVRTYGPSSPTRGKFDDRFGCPLRDLNLLVSSPPDGYRLANSKPDSLPGAIVLVAILDFALSQPATPKTVNLARLATEPGGPGRAFRINDSDMVDLIRPLVDAMPGLSLSMLVGSPQLGLHGDPREIAAHVIRDHYRHDGALPPLIGPEGRVAFEDYDLLRLAASVHARSTLVS